MSGSSFTILDFPRRQITDLKKASGRKTVRWAGKMRAYSIFVLAAGRGQQGDARFMISVFTCDVFHPTHLQA